MSLNYYQNKDFFFKMKVVQKVKTYILCSIFFFPENRAYYEIMWNRMDEPDVS